MQRVASHGDRGAMKHRIHVDRAVVAHIFAVRAFRLRIAALVEITFKRHLRIRRHQDIVGEALDHRRRLAAKRRDQCQLVTALPRRRGKEIERMRADRKGDRQAFAACHGCRVNALEIGRGGYIGPSLISIAQAQATAADIPSSGRRIDRVIDGRAEITTAVVGVLRVKGELREIDVFARYLNFVYRSLAGSHLHHRLGIGEPSEILVVELVLADLERGSQAPWATRGLRNDLYLFGACSFEQNRLVGPFDNRAQPSQRHCFGMRLDLIHVNKQFDESAQPVLVQIDIAARHRSVPSIYDPPAAFRSRN